MKAVKNKAILVIYIIGTFIASAFIFYSLGIFKTPPPFRLSEAQVSPEKEQKMPYVFGLLSTLKTKGNIISNNLNESITFKGVMIPDPFLKERTLLSRIDGFPGRRRQSMGIRRCRRGGIFWHIGKNKFQGAFLIVQRKAAM